MIKVIFYENKKKLLKGFLARGHAGFLEYGKDIVCAAVSCAIQMCCNGITEILKKKVIIEFEEGKIFLEVEISEKSIQNFLEALRLQISLIEKQYPKNVELKTVEVI